MIYFLLPISFLTHKISGQQFEELPDKASPFTAIKWEKNIPQVCFKENWYAFEKIDGIKRDSILIFCQYNYGEKWKKRFSEDFIEVLSSMGHTPQINVKLELSTGGVTKTFNGKLSYENRLKVCRYNNLNKQAHTSVTSLFLTKNQVENDIKLLKLFIENNASYHKLNGFDCLETFDEYLNNVTDSVHTMDFGIELTKIIGKMGDRHANVKGYELPNTKFLPFAFAPLNNNIIVLTNDSSNNSYRLFNSNFPYLYKINGETINEFLPKILPEEIKAPKQAYFTRAVKELRDIEEIYRRLGKEIRTEITITLKNLKNSKDTTFKTTPVTKRNRIPKWEEQFYRNIESMDLEKKDYNKTEIIQKLFSIDDKIAYMQIPLMLGKAEAPTLFDYLNKFMESIKHQSNALIIDVRSNAGGNRDLIPELAGYFIHPDSIYVVNVARQRGELPLSKDLKKDLRNRYLFSFDEFDEREQETIRMFNNTFKPIYNVDNKKYSQNHYFVLNGEKLMKGKFQYKKPVFILVNERTFSAASVLTACFKEIPNIKIVGVQTDGSSGNSGDIFLPNSQLEVKLSTMVSFQKDGKVLDGIGTKPDIELYRDLQQIRWQRDSQLEKLKLEIEKQN